MPDGSALLVLQKTWTFGAQSVIRVSLATGQKQRLTFPKEIEEETCSSAPTFPEARFSFVPELDGVDVASLG
jgi:hypothetical protein